MNKLPLEVTQKVLYSLDDVDSLRAAALSCRALYAAFTSAEKLITTQVAIRQIHRDVIPEALAVEASRGIREHELDSFAQDYLSTRSIPYARWRLVDVLPMIRLYEIVEFLARRLARAALMNGHPVLSRDSSYQSEPTISELRRIQRALYRFHLYCNMFNGVGINVQERLRLYFRYFSTIEHEQLACVQDLLIRLVAKPYNDLVDHDVRWGALAAVPYITSSDSELGQHIISRGLERIYELATTISHEKRCWLLRDAEDMRGLSHYRLDDCLEEYAASFLPDETPVRMTFSAFTAEQKTAYIGKPYCDADHCKGIEDIWESGCGRIFLDRVLNKPMTLKYRLWGYVFWDRERIPDNEWQHNFAFARDPLAKFIPTEDLEHTLAQSREERRRIWYAGGSGWWSFHDRSQVVWPLGSGRGFGRRRDY
ncbi:hypothetical protein F5Y05DRAFT_387224 [Hypoxylon sp. FL0543]|nr:hypothetical protein F5Y05DRAFT_387224 [Hypoxylon sp. FL0543]